MNVKYPHRVLGYSNQHLPDLYQSVKIEGDHPASKNVSPQERPRGGRTLYRQQRVGGVSREKNSDKNIICLQGSMLDSVYLMAVLAVLLSLPVYP